MTEERMIGRKTAILDKCIIDKGKFRIDWVINFLEELCYLYSCNVNE